MMDWVIALKVGLFTVSLLVLLLLLVHFSVKKQARPRAMNLPKAERRTVEAGGQREVKPTDVGGGPPLHRFQPDHPEMEIEPVSPFSRENTQESSKNEEN